MSTSVADEVARGPRRARRRVNWRKLALAAVIFGSLIAFFALGGQRWASFETLKEHRQALLAFTQRHYTAMLIGTALVYIAATALSFPVGLAMSLAVGLLFGRWVGTALVVVSASIGSTLAFLSARYLFADAVRRKMGPRLQRMARGFHEDGFNYVLFTRLVPIFPFWLMNWVPAFTPVSTRTFFAATAVGILPGSFVFCYVGESLGRIASTRELVSADVLLSLTLLGLLSLVPILWKKLRTRRRRGAR